MKRPFAFLTAVVALGGITAVASHVTAQAPATPAPAARTPSKVAVFNVAQVMRDYQKWQHFAGVMNKKRADAAKDLASIRGELADLEKKAQAEPIQTERDKIVKMMKEKQRAFEDRETQYRRDLDAESSAYLKNLFAELQACVKAIVEANGYDLVLAYPDAVTAEEKASPVYYDLKMRPPAAMPFFVSANIDVTQVLVDTLNKHFPAPAAVAPAGATVPTPGQK